MTTTPTRTGPPALMLVASGACALAYQTVWLRELRLVFGASTAANAAVLAIFMGGLGLGSLLLGRYADRHRRPLALYGWLELGITLSAAASPLLLDAVRAAYVGLGGTPTLGATGGTLVRLGLSALVLGLPTVLMGGTLAAVVRAVERAGDVGRGTVGLLYAVNTVGSVIGVTAATFFGLEALGIRGLLWAAVGVNAVVAVSAVVLGRRWPAAGAAPPAGAASDAAAPAPLVLGAAFVAGFAFLLMELVWYRMLAPLLGGSAYSFGMILAMALAGIGAGGLAYGAWARGRSPGPAAFALTCALEAALMVVPFALGDDFALWAADLREAGGAGFGALTFVWFAVTAAAVLPAAVVSGFQFPLLIGLLGRGDAAVGRQVGQATAFNTAGAIAGSLAGGFGLIPLLGATGVWQGVAVLLVGTAVVTVAVGRARVPRPAALGVGLVVAVALGLVSMPGPGAVWRHSPIGAGRYAGADLTGNALTSYLEGHRRSILWEADGVESSIALQSIDGRAFVIHGKVDGHVIGDAPTSVGLGMLPATLHPKPARMLVVGLGTGQTAGWAAACPDVEHVDVIELEPAIVDVARVCAATSHDALNDPKVAVHIGDAREWLLATPETYDVVVSEPSNPYRAGIASLFTADFYAGVAEKLAPGGLFVQWVQGYEVSSRTVRTILATLHGVFPYVEVWEMRSGGDLLLVAGAAPVDHDRARLAARLETSPYREWLAQVTRGEGLAGLYGSYVGDVTLVADEAGRAEGRVNTDDRPVIEFDFARQVGDEGAGFSSVALRARAADLGADTPPVDGPPAAAALAEARGVKRLAEGGKPRIHPDSFGPETSRMRARVAWVDGEFDAVLRHWGAQDAPASGPLDRLVVGEALAVAGDARALALADAHAPLHPTEASLVRARLALARDDPGAALPHVVAALESAATDPWVHPAAQRRVLDMARELGQRGGPTVAGGLFERVARPFADGMGDEVRRAAALDLGMMSGRCVEGFGLVEPHPPWNRGVLAARAECYAASGSPLAALAAADLAAFDAAE